MTISRVATSEWALRNRLIEVTAGLDTQQELLKGQSSVDKRLLHPVLSNVTNRQGAWYQANVLASSQHSTNLANVIIR